MSIRITGRHQSDTEEIRACVEKKLSRLTRIVGQAQSISLLIDRDANKAYVLEILFKHGPIETRASAKDQQYTVAADKMVAKLEKQVARSLDKLRGYTKRATRVASATTRGKKDRVESLDALEEVAASFSLPSPEPVLVKNLNLKVYPAVVDLAPLMRVEEAAEAMTARKSAFMVFRNLEDEKRRSVMFRRPDGHFGLLEMDAR